MDPLTDARVTFAGPGRLRIALPALYRAPHRQRELETRLRAHPAIAGAWASPVTGRILLLHAPDLSPATLLNELGISLAPSSHAPRPSAAAPPAPTYGGAARPHPPLYPPWHMCPPEAALRHHGSSARDGLSSAEAHARLRQGGNRIAPAPRRSRRAILLAQFNNMPVMILALSAGVSLVTGAIAEALAIGAVLAVNGTIGYRTEAQAEGDMASLSELVDEHALALRDGRAVRVDAGDVVPGDVLLLGPGTRIAADLRLLEADGLRIDESPLTGESVPTEKHTAALAHEVPLAERRNMAYRGTAVCAGRGAGLAVGTGSLTEAGAVDALTRSVQRPPTPIQAQLEHLGKQLVFISAAMCLGVIAVGLLRGQRPAALIRSAIALGIAAVPEGLPAVATTSLSRGLRRMREQQVLIRHLHAVEAIGTVSTICLDKTGTLTMNKMSAVAVHTVDHAFDPARLDAAGPAANGALARLLQVCVLCNEAGADHTRPGTSPPGSATENALVELAQAGGVPPSALRARYPMLACVLRAEGRNYMRTTHALPGSSRRLLAVKGNPADVLALCDRYLDDGKERVCDDAVRTRVLGQNADLTTRGLRVLGFACAETMAVTEADVNGTPLIWLGLVGLADPLRPDVASAIERFHAAGIRTTMLTGDQAGTACQIGKALRLSDGDELNVVDAAGLTAGASAHLPNLAAHAHIVARVTPSEKLRIVEAIRAGGARVAMTGDGINDSPALRAADVGIAMGSGTDMALSVADIALKHDRLDAVLEAIAQGRTISDNIHKAVHFLVSSNLSEILIVFGAVALGGASPLSPLQLLWLNLLTDILPAIGLAEEPAEPDVMQRPPRDPRAPLVNRSDLLQFAREAAVLAGGSLGAYAYGMTRHGGGARAATIAFDTAVAGQLLHALLCRSARGTILGRRAPPNASLTSGLAGAAALQILAHLVPGLRRILGLAPLGPTDLLAIAAGAGLPLLINDLVGRQISAATSASAERSTSFSTMLPMKRSAMPSTAGVALPP